MTPDPHVSANSAARPTSISGARQNRIKSSGITAFLCAVSLIFSSLVILWLGQTSARVYQEGAAALTIRAILRADTDDVAAELLAAEIREQVPGVSIEIINEAMGRSLLALQEPWIAQMPDFEVTPLPILLEINHPDLLTTPEAIAVFVAELGTKPIVDFVAYNETAHDRLAKFASSSAQIEKHAMSWLLFAFALVGLAATYACGRVTGNLSILREGLSASLIFGFAWSIAWIIYRQWEATALTSGNWQRLGLSTHLTVGTAAFIVIIMGKSLSVLVSRLRR